MSGYIGNVPVPQATQTRETFTATASQTSFATAGYNPGYIDVFLNGVKLVDGTDYTATNGSDVVLSTGAAASDILEVVAYSTFEVANQAFTGDFSVDSPTFVVDSTNNRVGIGTTSPFDVFHVRVGTDKNLYFTDGAGETGNVATIQGINNAGSALASVGVRGTDIRLANQSGEAMRITSSGNVGIGTSSPSSFNGGANNLVVGSGSGSEGMTIYADSSSNSAIFFADGTSGATAYTGQINYLHASDAMSFHTNGGTERMRIDSSGNVLVGKTADTYSVAGASIRANPTGVLSGATVTRDGANVVSLNRLTSDGDILTFSKDTTTVGSISSHGGGVDLGIGSGDVGLRFQGSSDAMFPFNTVSNSGRDNAIDLGLSDNRFRNLYLSGGVYLGGTGAANYLDDYEEGTWTPVIYEGTATYTAQRGRYTKIGRVVYIHFYINIASISGSNNYGIFTGLPFTAKSDGNYAALASKTNSYNWGGSSTMITFQVVPNTTRIAAVGSGNNQSFIDVSSAGISAGTWVAATGHYVTDA